ncbi:plasmid recombination protein [Sphingobacterium sp. Mn56C]|uniref:plasmid recombination protein n=1 Tax=Sphingobacterium sp. Mn56C TaxID=3395261 RepID=UPI003BC2DB47
MHLVRRIRSHKEIKRTPHLHVVAAPLTKDERLSAKAIFGNRTDLSDRQTCYVDVMREKLVCKEMLLGL